MKIHSIAAFKGAGDLASGAAIRLWRSGFRVILTELPRPLCIRRSVAFANTVFDGNMRVEDVESALISDCSQAEAVWAENKIPVIIDPEFKKTLALKPDIIIDARI
ncbi:MAG: molybdenum hydroxylase, partial [Flexilinea flocculi]|nr:molybdenum hydroxylase [Flexilinea flocculi]